MFQRTMQSTRACPAPAPLLAVLTTALLAPLSPASVVVHDNSAGVFQWKLSYNLSGTDDIIGTFLDITQPATQSGLRAPGSVGVWYEPNISSSEAAHRIIVPEIGGETSRTDNVVDVPWNDDVFHVRPTRDYEHGEYVSSRDNWQTYSIFFWHHSNHEDLDHGTPGIKSDAYLGVKLRIGSAYHFGWIHFMDYQTPLAWAYETEAGVPIQIPVPAAASGANVLLLLSMGFCTRRRGT